MKKRLLSIMVGVALLLTMMSTAFATPGANMPSGDTQLEAGGALGFEITVSKDSTGKKATVSLDSGTNTVNIVIYDAAKEPDGLSTNGYSTMSSDVYDQEGDPMTRGTDYDHNSGTDVASVSFPASASGAWVVWANCDGSATEVITANVTLLNGKIVPDQSKLVFKLDGGNVGGNTADVEKSVDAGSTVTLADVAPTPKKAGFKFGGWSETAGGAAVTTVTAAAKDATKEVFAIWTEKDTLSAVNFEQDGTLTYNGREQTVTVKKAAGTTGTVGAITYAAGNKQTNAGNAYTVTINVAESDDYKAATGLDITWTIGKAELVIGGDLGTTVKEGKTVTVKGKETVSCATVANVPASAYKVEFTSNNAAATVDKDTGVVTGVTAGGSATITATLTAVDTTNYTVKTATTTGTVTVTDATAPDFTVKNNEHTYDGTAKTATVTATVEGNPVTITGVTYGGAADQTNANEAGYEIKATVDGKEYTLGEKLVIKKATPVVTPTFDKITEANKTLADANLAGSAANAAGTDVPGTIAWTDAGTTPVEQGKEYEWTFTPGDAANYNTVTGKLIPWEKAGGSGIVIGGSKQTYTVTYNVGSHGNFSSDASTTEKVAKNETPKNVPVVHPHDNYRFMGWTLDGKTVVDPTTQKITKNVTFTALYEACDHMAYMVGRSDTQFAPNGNLTRAEAATILSRLTAGFDENGTYAAAPYSDLNTAAWYAKYVNFAASKGIVNGRPDGTFDPDASITRAEFATMIANFAGVGRVEAPSASNDVAGHWAAGYIVALERANIVTGYEDGTFRPNANITRAEAATMVNGAIDRTPDTALDLAANSYTNPFTDVTAGQWFFAQVMEATVNHVTAHFHTDK